MRNTFIIACITTLLMASAQAQPAADTPNMGMAPDQFQGPGQAQPAADTPNMGMAPDQFQGPGQAQPAADTPRPALREQCEQALRSDEAWRSDLKAQLAKALINEAATPEDAKWRAELKQDLAAEVHTEDAQTMLTNKKHVVMAYAALWMLVAAFVALMWMKQQGLKAEIARLQGEIREAAKQSDAG